MGGGDAAIAVNNKSGRQRFDATVHIGGVIVAQHHPVVHFQVFQEGLHHRPAVVIHGDAQHGESAILLLLLELGEPGNFEAARTAPRGPEIEHHHFAAIVGEMHSAPIHVFQSKVWRHLAARGVLSGIGMNAVRIAGGPPQQSGCGNDGYSFGYAVQHSSYILRPTP